jgi:hypothetical protein
MNSVYCLLTRRGRHVLALACGLILCLDALAAMQELADCERIPEEIVFQRHSDGGASASPVERYERYGPGKWVRADFKNPARAELNGPAHARNCSPPLSADASVAPSASWQRLSFRMKSVNYFGSGLADHLAVALRATFDRAEGTKYAPRIGRGVAMFSTATYAETFPGVLGTGATLALQDDTWYEVEVVASSTTTSATLKAADGNVAKVTWQDAAAADGTGYGFAVLCAYSQNGSCEYPPDATLGRTPFEVRFSEIVLTWFLPEQDSQPPHAGKRGPRQPVQGVSQQ